MQPAVAYLSDGRLFVKLAGREPREVQSAFAAQVMERQARNAEVHGWKSQSGVWGQMGLGAPELALWDQQGRQRTPVRIQGAVAGDVPGHLYYILGVGDMGGLFHYVHEGESERRLMHRNGFMARDIARNPHTGEVAVSVHREDGSVGIQVGANDGRFLREVTVGDAVDEAPSWVPGEGRRLVYQSAGIGRDEHGFAVGLSTYRIELMDLDRQTIETVHEEVDRDLLQPRMRADGTVYFIRRPYEPPGRRRLGPWTVLKDILLFPFRLGRAIFHFLNFYSVMFSGKPLTTNSGPQQRISDTRFRMIWGRMIDTKRAMETARKEKSTGLVPKEWQFVRRTPDGNEDILAERVLSFDLCEDGSTLYTDGTVIFHREVDGETREVCRDQFVEKVIAWREPPTEEPNGT